MKQCIAEVLETQSEIIQLQRNVIDRLAAALLQHGMIEEEELAMMQQAADRFVGAHDFAAVRSVGTDVKSTVRTVHYFDVERRDQLILLRICANGFLYNMARAMSGTVIYAAEGKFPPEAVTEILEKGDRTAAGPTLPPGGLYMTKLWYECGEVSFHVG